MSDHQETEDEFAERLQGVTDQLGKALGEVNCTEEEMGDVLVAATLQTLVKTRGELETARRFYVLAISLSAQVEMAEAAGLADEALRRAGANLN